MRENYLEEEEEKDANVWSPNVQPISKMENVIVDAVIREDVVRDHLNVNASLANLSKLLQLQVNNHEIVIKKFQILHNLTWYSAIVHKFTRIYQVSSTYELTKQFM